jgi:hypothetical protein
MHRANAQIIQEISRKPADDKVSRIASSCWMACSLWASCSRRQTMPAGKANKQCVSDTFYVLRKMSDPRVRQSVLGIAKNYEQIAEQQAKLLHSNLKPSS